MKNCSSSSYIAFRGDSLSHYFTALAMEASQLDILSRSSLIEMKGRAYFLSREAGKMCS